MNDDSFNPDQQAPIHSLELEFMLQLERVGVDMRAASTRLREPAPPTERRLSADEFEVTRTIDVSAILETLRRLPDDVGTEAFVAAYNAHA